MKFVLYSSLLGVGAALVGLVIGFLLKSPPPAIASILIVIGIGFVALAGYLGRRLGR